MGSADRPQLVQVGWYGRNQRGIYQVDVPEDFRKIHLLQDRPWIARALERTDTSSPYRSRPWKGQVEILHELDDWSYDQLLACSLIFNEYWDVSASNTVIEAIARNTPMVVNRHPALAEYLGHDYPLFFDDIGNVIKMLQDRDRIRATTEYLLAIEKTWMSAERFAEDIVRFVHSVAA